MLLFRSVRKKEGRLWIGTASLMPDDHIDGFRADVLALLRGLKAPVYIVGREVISSVVMIGMTGSVNGINGLPEKSGLDRSGIERCRDP